MHPVDDRISDRVLGHGEGLIVAFPTQNVQKIQAGPQSIPTVRAYFFRIAKVQKYRWTYSQLTSFNDAESLDYNYLGDTGHGTGDDVLRLEGDDFKVYHVGFGLHSPDLRVYEKIDPANPNRAVDHNNQSDPDPTAPSAFGYYDGKQQDDTFDPPAHTERLSIRSQRQGQFLQFGFYAENAITDANADIEIIGKTYELAPVLNPQEQAYLLQQNLARRAGKTPDLKTIKIQVGGIFTYEIGEALPDGWVDLQPDIYQDLTYKDLVGSPGQGGQSQAQARTEAEQVARPEQFQR